MNLLPREKQIEIISALCEGVGQRAVSRFDRHRPQDRSARLALRCRARRGRIARPTCGWRSRQPDESATNCGATWATSAIRRKQAPASLPARNEATSTPTSRWHLLAARSLAICTGKRTPETTDKFIQDLRQRVIGSPEITTDGYHPYKSAIRDAFGRNVSHGVHQQNLFGNPSECNGSVAALFAGTGNRRSA